MGILLDSVSRMTNAAKPALDWENRYGGMLTVGIVDNVPVAGISGPWPDGKFSLTWWSNADEDAAPRLEFHASMDSARQSVEEAVAKRSRAA